MMKDKDTIVVNITKKDKVYLSIIGVLILIVIALCIVLPRPYKFIEVETPVYEKVYRDVYQTEKVYLISTTSVLYDDLVPYVDSKGNEYKTIFTKNYIDTGSMLSASVSLKIDLGQGEEIKKLTIDENLIDVILDYESPEFGVDVKFSSAIMSSVLTIFENLLNKELNVKDNFLFEFSFENAKVNAVVSYIID